MERLFSAFEFMFMLWKTLLSAVAAKGGEDEDLELVIGDPELAAKLAQLIMRHPESTKSREEERRRAAAAAAKEAADRKKAEEAARKAREEAAKKARDRAAREAEVAAAANKRRLDEELMVALACPYKVEVDYGLSLEAMIAAGHYDWVNSDITSEHFPISGEGKAERELVLVHPNKVASTDEVQAELDSRGLRPAKIEELLALGAARPELQKEFSIVALGSSFVFGNGRRGFAFLRRDDAGRRLYLDWDADVWHGRCRFLAARK